MNHCEPDSGGHHSRRPDQRHGCFSTDVSSSESKMLPAVALTAGRTGGVQNDMPVYWVVLEDVSLKPYLHLQLLRAKIS